MKVIAVNGGPRKNWNTATLLEKALEGAAAAGAGTELVHLYDLNYKGCISCFSCKLQDGRSYGSCAVNDDLTPLLGRIAECDGLVVGSPVYLGEVTGMLRSFLERLVFPYLVYDKKHSTLFNKRIKTGFIYTMNVTEDYLPQTGYRQHFQMAEEFMARIFGAAESLYVTDTLQFEDYSKYVGDLFDPVKKAERRRKVFPEDCRKAYEMGQRMAQIPGSR